jgi:2-dehydro-3-deoxyphosphooctonate aldolase (KDO 8-P synthase)
METSGKTRSFKVGAATFGDGRLTIIAGPCVIESHEHAMMMARECSQRARAAGLDYVLKSSFDKANRSSVKSFRGLGMEAGLEILGAIKKELNLPVLTDVHDTAGRGGCPRTSAQIPAFLAGKLI